VGDWHDSDVYLGYRRLSILDCRKLAGPMRAAADEVFTAMAKFTISLLRAASTDHTFTSGSDSRCFCTATAWGNDGLVERIEACTRLRSTIAFAERCS
jgi:hypothetical protein